MVKIMEQTAIECARGLVRIGDFGGAYNIVEGEIQRIGEVNSREVWRLRFIRAQVLEARGQVEEALNYLESLPLSEATDLESIAALKMHRASYAGFLGRCETSHRLFDEAEIIACDACLFELLGEIHLSEAFIFFRQKDYVSSDSLFRSALSLSEKIGGWYLRGHGRWGVGKNLMI